MPLVEIEDAYLSNLAVPYRDATAEHRRAVDHEQFFAKVANGKNRRKLMELLKDEFPDAAVPEIDAAKPVLDEVAALRKEMQERFEAEDKRRSEQNEERSRRRADRAIEEGRDYLRKQGFDDDLVSKTEELMRERNIGDYEVAAAYMAKSQPSAEPLPSSAWSSHDLGTSWFHPPEDAPDHKLLLKDPKAFAAQEVAKIMKERAQARVAERR